MAIDQITDHVDRAKRRLLMQYKDKPLLEGLLSALVEQLQEIEDVMFDLKDGRSIYNATGLQLDHWGDVVGRSRQGISDDDIYRTILFIKIAENTSEGTPEDVIDIFGSMLQATRVEYSEMYPASFIMTAIGADSITGNTSDVIRAVNAAKPAGVESQYLAAGPDESFGFDGDPDPNAKGFGSTTDATVGGTLVSIL